MKQLRYVPGQTTESEFVQQAGLPSRIEQVNQDGKPYRRLIYNRGADSMTVFVPVAAPVGTPIAVPAAGSGFMGGITQDTYKLESGVAYACLVSNLKVIVDCIGENRK